MKVRKAIIPAAGLGTRLLPNTKSIPKEMLPRVDKPVIQYIVEEAVAAGVEEILIITNRGKNPIEDYFDYAPDLEERLIHDGKSDEAATVRAVADMADVFFLRQKETKGLGHAVWRAKSFVGNEPFAVLLGDDIMLSEKPVLKQLVEAAEANSCSAVAVREVPDELITKYSSVTVSYTHLLAEAAERQEYCVRQAEKLYSGMRERQLESIEALDDDWQSFLCGLMDNEGSGPSEKELSAKVGAIARELAEIDDAK